MLCLKGLCSEAVFYDKTLNSADGANWSLDTSVDGKGVWLDRPITTGSQLGRVENPGQHSGSPSMTPGLASHSGLDYSDRNFLLFLFVSFCRFYHNWLLWPLFNREK